MSKAAQLAERLDSIGMAAGMAAVQASTADAVYFDVVDEVMCVMHPDGSVNMIELLVGQGRYTVETISADNILKVLKHYRPFREVFEEGQLH